MFQKIFDMHKVPRITLPTESMFIKPENAMPDSTDQ